MSYKLLFPTYRTRLRYVVEALDRLTPNGPVPRMLNLGSGEGDVDRTLKEYADRLDCCDIQLGDVEHARRLNADVEGIHYAVEDGEALTYPNGHFQIVCCLEVIEHVKNPERLLEEIWRVLAPGGHAVITAPSDHWPLTYDPVNVALRKFGTKLPLGAFAYGHDRLIREEEIERWFGQVGLEVLDRRRLSKALASVVELYWPGALQRVFKANAANVGQPATKSSFLPKLRPKTNPPPGIAITDALIDLDDRLFKNARRSVGLGYVVEKPA
jgi:2-polyprenyl-3-methyl-5-hydroxy-6-metoxy-1,4-benzoquinol methylase